MLTICLIGSSAVWAQRTCDVPFSPAFNGLHWATLYLPYTVQVPEGVQAYTGYVEQDGEDYVLRLVPVTGNHNSNRVIPVFKDSEDPDNDALDTGTAVILSTTCSDSPITFTEYTDRIGWSDDDVRDWAANPMRFSDETVAGYVTTLTGTDDGFSVDVSTGRYLVLGAVNGEVGFYEAVDGKAIPAHRAYLRFSLESSGVPVRSIRMVVESSEVATSVESVATREDGRIYDMMGREVRIPCPGHLYIRNGQKFIAQ